MAVAAPTYDLVLILDPGAAGDARAKIVADARRAIEAGGELTRHDEWGERPLAYPIEHRASGDYHLMQFHAGGAELLDGLGRSLRIADEVLRFRIVKLRPGVPEAPDMRHAGPLPRRAEGEQAAAEPAADTASEPAAEPAAQTTAERAAETASEPVVETAAQAPAEPAAAAAEPGADAGAAAAESGDEPAAEAASEPAADAAAAAGGDDGEAAAAEAGDA